MRRNNDIFLGQIKRCRRSSSNLQEESKSLSLSFLSFQVHEKEMGDEPVRDAAGVIVAAMTISEPHLRCHRDSSARRHPHSSTSPSHLRWTHPFIYKSFKKRHQRKS